MVLAGIPIGVANAQEPPITHAISTALGSAPMPCAMDTPIGAISAVVAVFDIKFVMIQQSMKITNVNMYGEGLSPSIPITLSAISSPAPVASVQTQGKAYLRIRRSSSSRWKGVRLSH